jgi:hypothetical protein
MLAPFSGFVICEIQAMYLNRGECEVNLLPSRPSGREVIRDEQLCLRHACMDLQGLLALYAEFF